MKPVLIVGIGNILLRDEGVGVHVVRKLMDMELPEGVEAIDGGTSGADLIDSIADRAKLIVVDAMKADEKPGTVYRFTDKDLMEQAERSISLHEFGLAETLSMAKHLGCSPKEVIIYGVQPAVIRPPGLELSPEIAAVVPKLIKAVLEEAAKTL
ncbi:MAG: hydrogenase maturation protease [Phycisphaerae bacterium]